MKFNIDKLNGIRNKTVCRVQVFNNGDFSIGFGEKVYHNKNKLRDNYYGEWEIGTFHKYWEVYNKQILLGSGIDSTKDNNLVELTIIKVLSGSSLSDIIMIEDENIRIMFSNGISLKVAHSDDETDESFHVFCPNGIVWEFSFRFGWRQMKSTK